MIAEITQRAAVGMLAHYTALRHRIAKLEKERELMADFIKSWLRDNPSEELVDGEAGIRARLQEREGTPEYDVASMPDALVLWAQAHHILQLNHKRARYYVGESPEGDALKGYRTPGQVSEALVVWESASGGEEEKR